MQKTKHINIILIVTFVIISLIFAKIGIDTQNQVPNYKYEIEKNSDYSVKLKPNDFYENEILTGGTYYASKSIDTYNITLSYKFIGNKNANIKYSYSVVGNLVGLAKTNDNLEKEVWNREYIFLNNSTNNNEIEFNINEPITIDYDYYNNFAREYEKKYGITINAVLKLRLNVSYNIYVSNSRLNTEEINDYVEVEIPITNTVTEVRENYEKNVTGEITPKINTYSFIYYAISGIFILLAIAILIKNKKTQEEAYILNIKHIFKYYKDIIVTVTNEPDLNNLSIMNVAKVEDIIDVAEQNQKNIIHYEKIKNQKSNLYVIVDKYAYMYEVTGNKLE